MNKLFILLILVSGLVASVIEGQIIQPAPMRGQLLDGMQLTMGNIDLEAVDYSAIASPFNLPKEKEPEEVLADDTSLVITRSDEPLDDAVALKIISDQFKPLGSLVMGNRGVLQLANGKTIEKGVTFPAKIRGQLYRVKISEVTSEGYTLQLGSADISKAFLTTSGATR